MAQLPPGVTMARRGVKPGWQKNCWRTKLDLADCASRSRIWATCELELEKVSSQAGRSSTGMQEPKQ